MKIMNRIESAIERMQALAIALIILAVFSFLTSCSYARVCPTYSQHNKKTAHGEKAQTHYAKKHKKIHYLMF